MNWEAIGASGEVISTLVVIVSVFYLALELRQANAIARFTSFHELLSRFNEINALLLKDQSLRELLSKNEELSEDEEERLYVYVNYIANIWMSVQEARDDRLIGEKVFRGLIKDVEVELSRWPQIQRPLELFLSRYPDIKHYQIFDAVLRSKREKKE